ncbi:MAG TPA: glycosyltransferase family 9 protein [Gammaproteobacteria bacterium]|nr:glycosyltransferase family 9 protein [Gammaproteobacteria bacterium]
MASRLQSRLMVISRALPRLVRFGRRRPPVVPQRILIAHHLLLGDTLMLTPLLAKLRQNFPSAEIVMTTPKAITPLYAKLPYGVRALPYDPRDAATLPPLFAESGFDLAIVPGDNRHSWLALALGARWIVAFAGDRPAYKSWPVDELIPYPNTPAAWGDMVAQLAPGSVPRAYAPSDWPEPPFRPFDTPTAPYCVLHVGASTPLKLWEPEKWHALARALTDLGLRVVWSGGKNEQHIVAQADPDGDFQSYAGRLDLAQLWHLVQGAQLLVSHDTGVAHLGRLTGTPTVTLFGPGSSIICGAGDFWRNAPYRAVTIPDFPCRNQHVLFKREIAWVRRCGRGVEECPAPRCMRAIDTAMVMDAVNDLCPSTANAS